jgi:DNA-binding winged helix-turn-helix (wHTH) protein/TolB-like protein
MDHMTGRVTFGIFDFDVESGELRRDGVAVRLQGQPTQVLAVLVRRAGEVVTREELRQAIWGSDTFVDFDRGLNYCVAQIRGALGDSADAPRFIRTIPKRGYQFVAPVGGAVVAPAPRRQFPVRWMLATGLLIAAAVGLVFAARGRTVNIAVARFDNETGSAEMGAFTDGLTDSVVAELTAGAGERLRVIGNAAVLRRPRAERDLRAIGASLDARIVVLGQVQRSESHVRVIAHLIRLPEQTHLKAVRYERDVRDGVETERELSKLIAEEFLRKLGSSPLSATR